jgi:hypothetical protein
MKLKTWRESGNYYNYKGFSIFYRLSQMSDEVVLCLHGFRLHHSITIKYTRACRTICRLSFDMIGYGFSAKPANYDTRLLIKLMFYNRCSII